MSHPSTWASVAIGALPDAGQLTIVDTDGVTKTVSLGDFKKRMLLSTDIAWMTGGLTNVDSMAAGDFMFVWDATAGKIVTLTRDALLDRLLNSEDLSWMTPLAGASVDKANDKFIVLDNSASGQKLATVLAGDMLGTVSGWLNVKDFGAIGDYVADDTAEIQAAIDAIPSDGGTVFFPPGQYKTSAPLMIRTRNTHLMGFSMGTQQNFLGVGWHTSLKVATVWNVNEGMIQTDYPYAGTGHTKGGLKISGIQLYCGPSGAGTGVCGLHLKKQAGDNDFWGDIKLQDVSMFNGNIGVWADANGSGEGFGWITINQCQIGSMNYGVKCTERFINIFRCTDSKMWQNKQAASGSYTTRTGGGIYITSGTGAVIRGNDLEGCQVGVHLGMKHVSLDTNYYEGCYDAGIVLSGAQNVAIRTMTGTGTTGYRSSEVYCYNCQDVTLEHGGHWDATGSTGDHRAFLVLAPYCRDVTSDTPTLTRYTTDATGDPALVDDVGFWLRGESRYVPRNAPIAANVLINTVSKTGLVGPDKISQTWVGIASPFGQKTKGSRATTTANYKGLQFNWQSARIEKDQWAIASVWARANVTNVGISGNFVYVKLLIDGGIVWEGSIKDNRMHEDEWIQIRFIYKETVPAGDDRVFGLFVGPTANGDLMDYSNPSLIVARTHDLDSFGEVVGDTQHFLYDGAQYHGSAKPTDSTQTWAVGEVVYNTAPAPGGSMGWVCTTAGSPGTFKEFGAIEA